MFLRDALGVAAPFLAIAALVFGPATSLAAARSQRNPALWLAFGAVLGPVALLLVLMAPPARCRACGEPTSGFAADCDICGADVRLGRPGHGSPDHPTPAADDLPPGDASAGLPARRDPAALLAAEAVGRSPAVTRRRPPRVTALADPEPPLGADRDDLSQRLAAVGAQRPRLLPDPLPMTRSLPAAARDRLDLTMIAIGVYVRGSESLQAGSRYLVARTNDRLIIVGPIEPSDDHVELDLPLAGLEADTIADRLVLSGTDPAASGRRFVLAFMSIVPLAGRAVDDALLERRDGGSNAVGVS